MEKKQETQFTLAVIKPNVIENGRMGEVLQLIESWGFKIEDMEYIRNANISFVKKFYKDHEGKDFYPRLTKGMSNRPWLALKLSHKFSTNVVKCWRNWMKKIRAIYSGEELHDNAVHGSDSTETAAQEKQSAQ